MKKFMVADLVKHVINDPKRELETIQKEGGVSIEVAAEFLLSGNEWPLRSDNAFQWWVDNVREDITTDFFSFSITPSTSSRPRNMAEDPGEVEAELIYESIGPKGDQEAIFLVNVNWPPGSTEAPRTKTYEMPFNVIQSWSQNTSGTYFNANIRGKFAP